MITYTYIIILFMSMLFFDKYQSLLNKKSYFSSVGNIGFFILIFSLFLFTAIRHMVGWDYIHYYEVVLYNIDNNIVMRDEALTIAVVEVSRYFKSPLMYFTINAFILYFFLYNFIKRFSVDRWLSILLFITFPLFFLNSLSVVRIFTAIAIVLFAYNFLVKRKFLHYIVIVIIASMFHKSALFALTFILFSSLEISGLVWFVALAISPLLAKYIIPFASSYISLAYLVYLEPTDITEGTKALYFFVFLAFLMILFKKKIIKENYSYLVMYNIYMFGVCFYLVFIDFGTIGHRLSLYSTILSIILLPAALSIIKGNKVKVLIKLFFYILMLVIYFYTLNISREAFIPYMTIFDIY